MGGGKLGKGWTDGRIGYGIYLKWSRGSFERTLTAAAAVAAARESESTQDAGAASQLYTAGRYTHPDRRIHVCVMLLRRFGALLGVHTYSSFGYKAVVLARAGAPGESGRAAVCFILLPASRYTGVVQRCCVSLSCLSCSRVFSLFLFVRRHRLTH